MGEFSLADYPPMPPVGQAELDGADAYEQALRYRRFIRITGGLGMVAAATAIAVGVAERPAPIDMGPGISVDANIMMADYSSAQLGPALVGLPAAHANIHGKDFGVNLNIKKLDTSQSNARAQDLEGTLSDLKGTLTPSIESALYWRAGEGLAAFFASLGIMEGGRRLLGRRHKAKLVAEQAHIDLMEAYQELPDEVTEHIPGELRAASEQTLEHLRARQARRSKYKPWQTASAALAGLSITAGGTTLYHEYASLKPPAVNRTVVLSADSTNPLIQEVVTDFPVLANAFVTDDAGHFIKGGIKEFTEQTQRVNTYWRTQADLLVNQALPAFEAQGGMDWLNNPNVVAFMQVTDIHDSHPYLQYFLPTLIKAFNPDFLINTGDEQNYSGEEFLDNGAWQRFVSALPKTNRHGEPFQVILVAGNHDDKNSKIAHKLTAKTPDGKPYHILMPLDASDDFTATLDGITFVGSPDSNRTVKGTVPATTEGQMANDAKQGEQLAKIACAIFQKTHVRPNVLAHEPGATYAAAVSGCTSLDLSGHTHVLTPVTAIPNRDSSTTGLETSDSTTYQQTMGSASGDGPNNVTAIYNRATTTGTVGLWLYNKLTGKYREILISISPNGGVPTITMNSLQKPDDTVPLAENSNISDFLNIYDPAFRTDQTLADSNKNTGSH